MISAEISSGPELPRIVIPPSYNYIAAFLTFACNLRCSYCINRFGEFMTGHNTMSGKDWVSGLNRLVLRPDLPVTLQGGEPTLHKDFAYIINSVRKDLEIDVLTNLELDIDRFMNEVSPERIKRNAPYASIRASFHPETMDIKELALKVKKLMNSGYSIGIWGVEHPNCLKEIDHAREYCTALGIDFRTKEFLGEYGGRMYGQYKYPGACDRKPADNVLCRTTELLIGPSGDVFRCHSDLYEGREPIGHILDPGFSIDTGFRPCSNFGRCNPCDVKVKTNRFQEFGHTSVEIRFDGSAE